MDYYKYMLDIFKFLSENWMFSVCLVSFIWMTYEFIESIVCNICNAIKSNKK